LPSSPTCTRILSGACCDTWCISKKLATSALTRCCDDRSSEGLNELCVKSQTDIWVVGRRSEQREFYVILNKKDATLIDISGESILCITFFFFVPFSTFLSFLCLPCCFQRRSRSSPQLTLATYSLTDRSAPAHVFVIFF